MCLPQPDFKAIKKRIEDLITRDYLERDKDNANTYRYLAWLVLVVGCKLANGGSCRVAFMIRSNNLLRCCSLFWGFRLLSSWAGLILYMGRNTSRQLRIRGDTSVPLNYPSLAVLFKYDLDNTLPFVFLPTYLLERGSSLLEWKSTRLWSMIAFGRKQLTVASILFLYLNWSGERNL